MGLFCSIYELNFAYPINSPCILSHHFDDPRVWCTYAELEHVVKEYSLSNQLIEKTELPVEIGETAEYVRCGSK